MRSHIDGNLAALDAYMVEQDKSIARLPFCRDCSERITAEWAYKIDGEWICEDCMFRYFVNVEYEEE